MNELAEKRNLGMCEIAYIGDDLNDLPAIMQAGVSGCPADAVEEVRKAATYVCKSKGGEGALREFAEWVVKRNLQENENG